MGYTTMATFDEEPASGLSKVEQRFAANDKCLDRLFTTIEQLTKQLQPALKPPAPETDNILEDVVFKTEAQSLLCDHLDGLNERIMLATRLLKAISRQLEL